MALRKIKRHTFSLLFAWSYWVQFAISSPAVLPDSVHSIESQIVAEGSTALRKLMASNQANFEQGNPLSNQYVFTIGQSPTPLADPTTGDQFSALYKSGDVSSQLNDNASYLFKLVEVKALNQELIKINTTLYQKGKPLIYVGIDYLLGNIYKYQYVKNGTNITWKDFDQNQDINQSGYVSVKDLYNTKYLQIFTRIKNEVINNSIPNDDKLYKSSQTAQNGIVIIGVGQFFEIKTRPSTTETGAVEPAFKRWFWNGMNVAFGPSAPMSASDFINQVNAAGPFRITNGVQESVIKFSNQLSDVLLRKATKGDIFIDLSKDSNGQGGLTTEEANGLKSLITNFNTGFSDLGIKAQLIVLNMANTNAKSEAISAKNGETVSKGEDGFKEVEGLLFQINLQGFGGRDLCFDQAMDKAIADVQALPEYQAAGKLKRCLMISSTMLYKAIFIKINCMTSEEKMALRSPLAQFSAGVVNTMVSDLDFAEGIKGIGTLAENLISYAADKVSNYPRNLYEVYTKYIIGSATIDESSIPDILLKIMPPGIGMVADATRFVYQAGVGMWRTYYTEGNWWRTGQLAVTIVPMLLTGGAWGIKKIRSLNGFGTGIKNTVEELVAAARTKKLSSSPKNKLLVVEDASQSGKIDAVYKHPDDPLPNAQANTEKKLIKACGACLVKGTRLQTPDGFKAIENIQEGQQVWGFDESTQQNVFRPVSRLFKWAAAQTVQLIAGKDTLRATAEHPILTDKGWIPAAQIQKGLQLLTIAGAWLMVDSVALANQTETVYNVEVAQTHTYFAGSGQWLVHNAEGCPLGLTAEATSLLLESNAFKALSLEQRTQLVADINNTLDLKNLFNSLHDKSDDLNRCVESWSVLKKAGSDYRLSASVLKDFNDLLKSNKFNWTIDNFDQLFTKMLRDVRLGTVVEYVDDVSETVSDVVGKTLTEAEMLQALNKLNKLDITNTNGVVKELCCESSWKFVGG